MATTNQGRALYAIHDGTYVLKLLGDVRIPLCPAIDGFVESMFSDNRLEQVLIDLSDTDIIDSTALGLLAKIAVRFRKQFRQKPVILSINPDVNRILGSMGFEKVFSIVYKRPMPATELRDMGMQELPAVECTEECVCDKVLEAHKVLMSMNDANKETFKDVVETLEHDCGRAAGEPRFAGSDTATATGTAKHNRWH